jgi:hypothetical protein
MFLVVELKCTHSCNVLVVSQAQISLNLCQYSSSTERRVGKVCGTGCR